MGKSSPIPRIGAIFSTRIYRRRLHRRTAIHRSLGLLKIRRTRIQVLLAPPIRNLPRGTSSAGGTGRASGSRLPSGAALGSPASGGGSDNAPQPTDKKPADEIPAHRIPIDKKPAGKAKMGPLAKPGASLQRMSRSM